MSSDFSLHLLILHPLIATLTASGPDSKELYLHAVSNHSGPMNPLSSYESTSFLSILCETQRSLIHLHLVQPFGKKDTVNRSLLEKCCLCGFQDAIFCLPSSPLLTRVSLHWLLLYPDLRCSGSSDLAVGLLSPLIHSPVVKSSTTWIQKPSFC